MRWFFLWCFQERVAIVFDEVLERRRGEFREVAGRDKGRLSGFFLMVFFYFGCDFCSVLVRFGGVSGAFYFWRREGVFKEVLPEVFVFFLMCLNMF